MRMTKTANPRDLPESTRPVAAHHQGDLRVMAAADRRSWASYAAIFQRARPRNRKPPMEAAGAVDAKNAPTAPWKTAQNAVSHSYHRPNHRQPECYPCSRLTLLPMFPVAPIAWPPFLFVRASNCRSQLSCAYGVLSGEPVAGATRFGARVTRFVSRKRGGDAHTCKCSTIPVDEFGR